jgi:hypothetical protein
MQFDGQLSPRVNSGSSAQVAGRRQLPVHVHGRGDAVLPRDGALADIARAAVQARAGGDGVGGRVQGPWRNSSLLQAAQTAGASARLG